MSPTSCQRLPPNHRTDAYGGSTERRLRWPLEVLRAMRAAWPAHLPMSVRLSAHDWVEGGMTPAEAVVLARAFKEAGGEVVGVMPQHLVAREVANQIRKYGKMDWRWTGLQLQPLKIALDCLPECSSILRFSIPSSDKRSCDTG